MPIDDLKDAFYVALHDLLGAERQCVKGLQKMIRRASREEVTEAFEHQLIDTRDQIERLEQVFETLQREPRGRHCPAVGALFDSGNEIFDTAQESGVRDALLLARARKVKHYEIAAYGTLRTWAEELHFQPAAELLEEILVQEKDIDARLAILARKTP